MISTLQLPYNNHETTTTTRPVEEVYYLGIHPLGSPSTMLERFAGVEKHLRDETGLNIRLKLYPTSVDVAGQGAVVRDIISGDISFAYLSSVTVVQAHENGPVIPFVCAQKEGLPAYYGHIAVRVNSPYEKIEDLRGKPVCSSTASSASGNLMPTAYLLMKGINKTTYFNPFIFLGSDDKAAEAVIAGTMEAAFINEATFDKYNRGGVKLRSIYRHPAVPEYPFCVNTEKVTPEELAKVKVALLTMHENDLNAIKLVEPKYDKWVAVEWEDYLGIKAAIDEVHGPKFYDVGNWTG